MEPVTRTPTSRTDYATLSAGYGAMLGAALLAARDRGEEPLRQSEIPVLGVATFALSKLLVREKVETWVREPFVEELPHGETRPRGSGLRFAIGEVLTCTRCAGAWAALALVAGRVARPREARVVTAVLAVTAVNDWLQAGFTRLTAEASAAEADEPKNTGPRIEVVPPDSASGRA